MAVWRQRSLNFILILGFSSHIFSSSFMVKDINDSSVFCSQSECLEGLFIQSLEFGTKIKLFLGKHGRVYWAPGKQQDFLWDTFLLTHPPPPFPILPLTPHLGLVSAGTNLHPLPIVLDGCSVLESSQTSWGSRTRASAVPREKGKDSGWKCAATGLDIHWARPLFRPLSLYLALLVTKLFSCLCSIWLNFLLSERVFLFLFFFSPRSLVSFTAI